MGENYCTPKKARYFFIHCHPLKLSNQMQKKINPKKTNLSNFISWRISCGSMFQEGNY